MTIEELKKVADAIADNMTADPPYIDQLREALKIVEAELSKQEEALEQLVGISGEIRDAISRSDRPMF